MNFSNKIHLNMRLACLKKTERNTYKLVFRITRSTESGHIEDTRVRESHLLNNNTLLYYVSSYYKSVMALNV